MVMPKKTCGMQQKTNKQSQLATSSISLCPLSNLVKKTTKLLILHENSCLVHYNTKTGWERSLPEHDRINCNFV